MTLGKLTRAQTFWSELNEHFSLNIRGERRHIIFSRRKFKILHWLHFLKNGVDQVRSGKRYPATPSV